MKIRTDRLFAVVLSLIITLSITLVTIVAVMAANSQTLHGSMSVSYHANNVAATLRVTYQVAGSNNATSLVNTTNNTDYLRFYATDATTTGELNGGNIYLTSSAPYVLFTFAFTNNATRDLENNVQGYDIRITLADNSVRNNVTAKYMTDTTAPSGTLSSKYETMSEASTSLPSAVYVGAEQTVYFYLLLEITDLDYGAQYASYSNAGVSWTLDHVDYLDNVDLSEWTINQDNVVTGYSGSSKNIVFPANATAINSGLFRNNTNITSVTIPSGYTKIGNNSFMECTNLRSVVFENGNIPTFNNSSNIVNNNCSSLGDNTTTTIEAQAFMNCSNLYSVVLPNNLIAINRYAFYYCRNLSSLTFPNGLTRIESAAFYNCPNITSLNIPSSLTSIAPESFGGNNLSSITVDANNSVYYSQNNCLMRKSDKTLIMGCNTSIIPNDCLSIGGSAFNECRGIVSINIPSSVKSIGGSAFSGCKVLSSITVDENNSVYYSEGNCIMQKSNKVLLFGCKDSIIPSDCTRIGTSAFNKCTNLVSINIPDSVTRIGNNAFYYCTSLKSVTIGSGVTRIDPNVFYLCYALTSVTLKNTNGWKADSTNLSSSDLSNTSTAANYLKSTYATVVWTRS